MWLGAAPGDPLPADDAAHRNAQYEYWWWFGHAITRDGRRLAYILIVYSKPWAGIQEAQFAITDLSNGTLHQAVEPLVPAQRGVTPGRFDLRGKHASATGGNGQDSIRLEVDGYRLDLSMKATKPAIPHYADGHFNAYCQDVYTYSRPRMRVTGTLRHEGKSVPVRGKGDFERLWGFLPVAPAPNWVHMNFQLRDGRDIMIFAARLVKGLDSLASLDTGWISDARGNVTTLHRGDFKLTPGRMWRRDATCAYPVEWDVTVKGERLRVKPALDASELRTINSPLSVALWPEFPAIWDGPTIIEGDAPGRGWTDAGHPCWI